MCEPLSGDAGAPELPRLVASALDAGVPDGGPAPVGIPILQMTRPRLNGGGPSYPSAARALEIEGRVLARCRILKDGRATDCCLIRSLPYLGNAVLAFLSTASFVPAALNGVPFDSLTAVPFNFSLRVAPSTQGSP